MEFTLKVARDKTVSVVENALDKIVRVLDPARANSRVKARLGAEMLAISGSYGGGYDGASRAKRSLKDFNPLGNDANADLLPSLSTLRNRSEDLTRNTALAAGVINTNITSVVGSGLRVSPQIDYEYLGLTKEQARVFEKDAERLFNLWGDSVECDITRTQTFSEKQAMTLRSVLVRGDVFTLLPYKKRKGSPFGLKIQTIEADRVENRDFKVDTPTHSGGIGLDSNGAPVTIDILTSHPGARHITTREWQTVRVFGRKSGRRNILHTYERKRPGQIRGEPYLAPVIELLKQLGRYTEAELMAAVVSGMFTVFIKSEGGSALDIFEPNGETGGKIGDAEYKLGNGAIVNMGTDDSVDTSVNPGRPNDKFDPFVLAILRQIGVALEIPYEVLIKHFTASYSASRGAMLEAWRYFLKRRSFLADKYCQPIYEAFIFEQVVEGRLHAPGFVSDFMIRSAYLKTLWIGKPQGQIDPKKENEADAIAEDKAWKTAKQNTFEKTGGDWEANIAQRAREVELKNKLMPTIEPVISEDKKEEVLENDDIDDNDDDTDLEK